MSRLYRVQWWTYAGSSFVEGASAEDALSAVKRNHDFGFDSADDEYSDAFPRLEAEPLDMDEECDVRQSRDLCGSCEQHENCEAWEEEQKELEFLKRAEQAEPPAEEVKREQG